ncbi:MazG family protein [Tomitella biformata]|uniref:MazG family protein n=1 Tax=Tomitella biformata TaxID=630403 RepID=UPI0004B1B8E2|nr:MazG family protein [Tomitella biformata]
MAPGDRLVGERLLAAVAEMDRLRGGSWEVAQTHETLRPYLLEEAYELLDALAGDDRTELRSELGDLLLQVLFHARIAEEDLDDPFTIDDVADALVAKLRSRAPRILDDDGNVIDEIERERMWQERKAAEKPRESCLDGIITAAPALALAQKVLTRVRAAGFPGELLPGELRVVQLGYPEEGGRDGDAEDRLRAAVLAFMATVRTAESIAHELDGGASSWPRRWRAAD